MGVIFSDEKIFTVEAKVNSHNDRVWQRKQKDIPENIRNIYHRQKPASVMVWAAVSKTRKSLLIFVEPTTKINTECYIKEILAPALIEMKKHIKIEVFTFQQDGCTIAYLEKNSIMVQRKLSSFRDKKMWPPFLT